MTETKVRINMAKLPKPANQQGQNGDVCSKCGGFGYTVDLKGKKLDCLACDNTGVRLLSQRELQNKVISIIKDLDILRQAILDSLHITVVKPEDIGAKP